LVENMWQWPPYMDGVVSRFREDVCPIRGRSGRGYEVSVPLEWVANSNSSLSIPDSNGAVTRTRDDALPFGRVSNRVYPGGVPSSGRPTAAPVSASQSRMVLSKEPETICRPLGE
jgi:hypothetical protein